MQSLENKIINRIYGHARGWVFFTNDFNDLGTRSSIDTALHRLMNKGSIRRVMRGIYDYPKYSKLLEQELGPDIEQVANALARKYGWTIQATGNTALNLIGLSTQIPTGFTYQTDGKTKTYQIGKTTLEFKKAVLRTYAITLLMTKTKNSKRHSLRHQLNL